MRIQFLGVYPSTTICITKELLLFVKYIVKTIPTIICNAKSTILIRGYGTLPQQVIGVKALKNHGTYNRYKIRRKLFIEIMYVKYYFKAMLNGMLNFAYNDPADMNYISSKKKVRKDSLLNLKKNILGVIR